MDHVIMSHYIYIYSDGYAEGIIGRQTGGCVLAHAVSNSTVEAFPLRLRMDGCYTTHVQTMSHNSV
jgi:hypothetical protein